MIAGLKYGQPFPFDTIFVPHIRLQAAKLFFQPHGELQLFSGVVERLPYDFSLLADGSDESVLRFARHWGVLGICGHGKLLQHKEPMCLPLRAGREFVEPVKYWRTLSRYVRSILAIKAALDKDQVGRTSDWKTIWRGPTPPSDRKEAAESLAVVASLFLSQANVQPMLYYAAGRFAVTFIGGNLKKIEEARSENEEIGQWLSTSGSLFAQLAIRTVLTIQEGAGWVICSNPDCRRLYTPHRYLVKGRLNFCPDCGKRVSWRLSKRRKAAEMRSRQS